MVGNTSAEESSRLFCIHFELLVVVTLQSARMRVESSTHPSRCVECKTHTRPHQASFYLWEHGYAGSSTTKLLHLEPSKRWVDHSCPSESDVVTHLQFCQHLALRTNRRYLHQRHILQLALQEGQCTRLVPYKELLSMIRCCSENS